MPARSCSCRPARNNSSFAHISPFQPAMCLAVVTMHVVAGIAGGAVVVDLGVMATCASARKTSQTRKQPVMPGPKPVGVLALGKFCSGRRRRWCKA